MPGEAVIARNTSEHFSHILHLNSDTDGLARRKDTGEPYVPEFQPVVPGWDTACADQGEQVPGAFRRVKVDHQTSAYAAASSRIVELKFRMKCCGSGPVE